MIPECSSRLASELKEKIQVIVAAILEQIMTGVFERKESQTSNLKGENLREWDSEQLEKTHDEKAEYYDEVKELRDTPERWGRGDTFEKHDDRLAAISHSITLIEDELIRRGEMRSGGVGSYRPMS